jgi:uncharacterized protein YgiM (DUF1202 family)
MRVPAAFLVLLLAVGGSPSASHAEKVKTNQTTKLLSRPGERGKALLTVEEGKKMTVIAKDGRWLKVRVAGRTGWVPRSKVDVSDEIARNTRRRPFVDGRGKGRGFGGEEGPGDRIGADAVGEGVEPNTEDEPSGKGDPDEAEDPEPSSGKGDKADKADKGEEEEEEEGEEGEEGEDEDAVVIEEDSAEARPTARVKAKTVALAEPDEESEESFDASPSMVLYPTGNKQGKYTEVETEDGDLGYVLTSSLEVDEVEGDEGDEGGPRARQIDARARLGVTFFSQSPNPGLKLTTLAATIALGGGITMPYKTKFIVGGELTYDYARGGVRNPDGVGTTGIGLHNLRLRALGGYDLKKPNGLALFGRLGLHYQSYQVANVQDLTKNKAKLPSEIITAPAIGIGMAIPQLTKKIGVRASLDTILFSSVSQTKNLEDGASPSARGALFEAAMMYRWRKGMEIAVIYDLTYFSMAFGARVPTSKRDPVMGTVSRGDQFHAFTVGLGKSF